MAVNTIRFFHTFMGERIIIAAAMVMLNAALYANSDAKPLDKALNLCYGEFKEEPMTKFTKYKSFMRLKKLLQNVEDISKEGVFTPERFEKMRASACGYTLLYAGERVNKEIVDELWALADESKALSQMSAMQNGDIVNYIRDYSSENRAALHTAMRDVFHDKREGKKALEASELVQKELEKLASFMKEIDKTGQFNTLVQIGIGGSELGPRALCQALQAYKIAGRKVVFLANVDPDESAAKLQDIDLKKALFVCVSKSGTTMETASNEEIVRSLLKAKGIPAKEHMVAVTMPKTAMDDENRYSKVFYLWDYIGGRFSVTSMVGGVALSFLLGTEQFKEILRGAHEMDKIALSDNREENLPLLAALLGIWRRNFLNLETVAVIPYSSALSDFAAHLQQCDMESNGKQIDKDGKRVDFETGPIIFGGVGTSCQHSFYQLLHQGTTIVPLELIGFKESQYNQDFKIQGSFAQEKLLSNLFAQSIAFATGAKSEHPNKNFEGNRPHTILFGKRLDPFAMGALLAYYEHKVAFQGFIWNINSFDQEGVQLGKKIADKILEGFIDSSKRKDFPLGDAYLRDL